MLLTVLLMVPALIPAQTTPELGIRSKTPTLKAFTNATIVISPQRTIENGTLVVEDGLIRAVGSNVSIPEGAMVYDLDGKYIYPGLIEPYSQYGVPEGSMRRGGWGEPPVYEADREGADAWNDAIHAEKSWYSEFDPSKKTARKEAGTLLELGYTITQSARMDGVFRGRAVTATLSESLPNDVILKSEGPQFMSFTKGSSKQNYPGSLMGAIAMIRQTLLDVAWYQKALVAYRQNPNQETPELNRALEALSTIKQDGFVFETDDELDLLRAHRVAEEFGVPIVHVGSNYEYSRIDDIKATGATIILPLKFPDPPHVKEPGDELDVDIADLRHWEWAPYNAGTLAENEIDFAFTTYHLKKKSDLFKHVRKAIRHGLDQQTALAALTVIPARIAGVEDKAGTLETGKLANFVIADAPLFDKETSLYSTWIRGDMEKEMVDLDQVDFRGTYAMSLADTSLTLKLSGDITKVRGKLTTDDVTMNLDNESLDISSLSFSVKLDTIGIAGVTRFSGWMSGDTLSGTYVTLSGETDSWIAVAIADTTEDNNDDQSNGDDDDGEGEEAPQRIARLTYPNVGPGFESLPEQKTVLVKNATVWTCDEDGVLENTDVLFEDGTVSAIGKDLEAADAIVIDATRKHLTPGVIDEHSHIAISGGVNEGTHAVTSEVRIGDVVNPEDVNIYRALAGGTTAARLLHGSANPIGGQAQIVKLRWGSGPEEMKFADSPPSIKFALGENVKQSNWGERYTIRYPQTRMGVETIIKDAFQAAVEYEAAWQAYNSLSSGERQRSVPPRRDLTLDALVDIKNANMWITCHSYHQTEMLMLMRLAEEFGFQIGTFTHVLEGYKVAPEMAEHGAAAGSFSDWWAYKFEVYDAIPHNPALLNEAGVVVSVNSDSPETGRHLNTEAAKSVQYADMTQEDALNMVTINPAKQLKVDDRVGSITVGKDADFVIWTGNPLSIYSTVEQTWIDGKKYFDIEQDREMRQKLFEEKNALVQKVLDKGGSSKSYGSGYKQRGYIWECEDVFDVLRLQEQQGARDE